MTRAALRAQQIEEELEAQHDRSHLENELEYCSKRQTRSAAQIHEDFPEIEAEKEPETNEINLSAGGEPSVRLALRDITDENYPVADSDQFEEKGALHLHVQSPQEREVDLQTESIELSKSTKKSRGKARGKTKKRVEAATVIESDESEELEEQVSTAIAASKEEPHRYVENTLDYQQLNKDATPESVSQPELSTTPVQETSGPGPAIEETEEQTTTQELISKTPNLKFDPAVHVSDQGAVTTEDSFVHSITSRSPSKYSQSQSEYTEPTQPFSINLQAHTPLRRTSSTNFEESFEAMDSLEDNIEQMTAGLPILTTEDINSPDSPIKIDRRSLLLENRSTTPNTSAARTPKSSTRLQSILVNEEKENTPLRARTPLTRHAAFMKSTTPMAKAASSVKPQTPAKELSPAKGVGASSRKPVTNASTDNKSPSPSVLPKKRETILHQSSMSFSNSPVKEQANVHKKRSTSSILSTAKPGFVPTKSTKPPTVSTFALPGEAVAEKLRAQKEAREEKMKEPKTSLAEQKAAKLRADREAREERVRQNQEKAREVDNTEKAKPVLKHNRPLSVHVQPSIPPRENKASQARMSRVFSGSDKENIAPQTTTAMAPSSLRTTLAVSKTRTESSITTSRSNTSAHRRSVIIQSPKKESSSSFSAKPRPSSAVITSAQHARIVSMSNGQRSDVSKEDAAQQKVRGKEVFQRARQTLQQEQKEKREKEVAAKKARAEAAAAGRLASREWAEKMMKKKQSQQNEAKNETSVTLEAVTAISGTS